MGYGVAPNYHRECKIIICKEKLLLLTTTHLAKRGRCTELDCNGICVYANELYSAELPACSSSLGWRLHDAAIRWLGLLLMLPCPPVSPWTENVWGFINNPANRFSPCSLSLFPLRLSTLDTIIHHRHDELLCHDNYFSAATMKGPSDCEFAFSRMMCNLQTCSIRQ